MRDQDKVTLLKELDISRFPNSGNFKLGFRPEFLNTPILVGRERVLVLPNMEKHRALFCIVDLENIIASHNEKTFAPSQGYPTSDNGRNLNDRNYETDKQAQAKVMKVAQNLEPNILISTTANEESTPVITIDGIVISGNNRTMSLKLATEEHVKSWLNYKDTLINELKYGGYGFHSETHVKLNHNMPNILKSVENIKFKYPVLVRIDLDFPEYKTEEMNKFNVDTKKSERSIDQAIRIAQQLEDNVSCRNRLINLVSELEIVSELYKSRDLVERFKVILLDCNLINENQIAKFFESNSLSADGKTMYSVILSSLVLSPKTLEISQNAGVVSATNKVINGIIPTIKNKQLEKGSLNKNINDAILIQYRMVNSNIKDTVQYINQPELFEEFEELQYKSSVINYYLSLPSQMMFKTVLKEYNQSMEQNQTENMFGEALSPDYIFESTFVKNLPENVADAFEDRFKKEEKEVSFLDLPKADQNKIVRLHERIQEINPSLENQDVINSLMILLDEI